MNANDLKQIESIVKKALTNVATKDDVLRSAEKVTEDIGELITDFSVSVDEHKVEKPEFLELKERVTKLERKHAATKSYD